MRVGEESRPAWATNQPTAGGAPLRVLAVIASDAEYAHICELLEAAPDLRFCVERVASLRAALAQLRQTIFDLVLLDHHLPDGEGLALLRGAKDRGIRAPIVMLSGATTIDLDLQAMALGVADFLDKDRTDAAWLERTVRYALARQEQAERLRRLAQYDELTGLANRSLFEDRLERALAWARRQGRLVAIMILDLNGFKAVNDALGHVAGDRLLTMVAARLTGRLRETDTVARLGGDEFALIIENLAKPEHAALVVRKLLDAVAPPFDLDGGEVTVSASIGVALYPGDGERPAELVRLADRAMYRAKAEGGNVCRFASDRLERRIQRGALLESDLRRALEQGELVLHFQPQVTLTAGVPGVSALARWVHPDLGLIGAERFLPLAENSGLLDVLTEWLLDAAAVQLRDWADLGLHRVHVAVPLWSRQQLAWSNLPERISGRLEGAGVVPERLEIELCETLVLADAENGGNALARLAECGVRLALDEFGRGPTSLRSLQLGVLDTLKLSRELHRDVPEDARRGAIVAAILALAQEIGLRVVAEGVERPNQLAFLRRHGCDAVQAFMSCPPLPADACTMWLRQAIGRLHKDEPGPAVQTSRLPAA